VEEMLAAQKRVNTQFLAARAATACPGGQAGVGVGHCGMAYFTSLSTSSLSSASFLTVRTTTSLIFLKTVKMTL